MSLVMAFRRLAVDSIWLRAVIDDLRVELASQRTRAELAETRLAYQRKFLRSAGHHDLIVGDDA